MAGNLLSVKVVSISSDALLCSVLNCFLFALDKKVSLSLAILISVNLWSNEKKIYHHYLYVTQIQNSHKFSCCKL
jgi:hypothetical protein